MKICFQKYWFFDGRLRNWWLQALGTYYVPSGLGALVVQSAVKSFCFLNWGEIEVWDSVVQRSHVFLLGFVEDEATFEGADLDVSFLF